MRGTERVISPAPLPGVLRGVPAEGVAGDAVHGFGSGEGLPHPSLFCQITLFVRLSIRVALEGDNRAKSIRA
jgi:hypothetical protein